MARKRIVAARANSKGNITAVKLSGNRSYTPLRTAYRMAKRGEIVNAHAVTRKGAKRHIRSNPDGRTSNNLDTMAGDT